MSKTDYADIPRGNYRHFKGQCYELIDIALHSETQEPMAVYRALYGDHGLWVRPLEMFFETIERDGKTLQRFQHIEN
ncbi:MAG: DUF1653 domain-containing protein [Proteobacteria bacterium]|nr:DUF1653 domain-containing protein [Pseudomonadota bacterium]